MCLRYFIWNYFNFSFFFRFFFLSLRRAPFNLVLVHKASSLHPVEESVLMKVSSRAESCCFKYQNCLWKQKKNISKVPCKKNFKDTKFKRKYFSSRKKISGASRRMKTKYISVIVQLLSSFKCWDILRALLLFYCTPSLVINATKIHTHCISARVSTRRAPNLLSLSKTSKSSTWYSQTMLHWFELQPQILGRV